MGGKAGGFISKKFFHPSSFRNQEKLWKAQNADEQETRKQAELEKRREEERQVESLKKQMYLAGQGKATDFLPGTSSSSAQDEDRESLSEKKKSDQKTAIEEENRRRAMLKKQAREGQKPPSHGSGAAAKLAPSRYPEDVFVLGHQAVWGSWYSMDEKRWGFACCKVIRRDDRCPLAEAEEEEAEGGLEGGLQPRGGARGHAERGGRAAGEAGADQEARGDAALIDKRLLQAAEERRSGKRKAEAELKERGKTSSYLAVLMRDPSNKAPATNE